MEVRCPGVLGGLRAHDKCGSLGFRPQEGESGRAGGRALREAGSRWRMRWPGAGEGAGMKALANALKGSNSRRCEDLPPDLARGAFTRTPTRTVFTGRTNAKGPSGSQELVTALSSLPWTSSGLRARENVSVELFRLLRE